MCLDLLAIVCVHDVQKIQGAKNIVDIVEQRLGTTLPHCLQPSKVDYRIKSARQDCNFQKTSLHKHSNQILSWTFILIHLPLLPL